MEKINFKQEAQNLDENLRQRAKDVLLYKQIMEVISQMTPKDIIRDGPPYKSDDPGIEIYELENGLYVYWDKESNKLSITPKRDYRFENMMAIQDGIYWNTAHISRTEGMRDLAFHLSSENFTSEFTYNCSSQKGLVHPTRLIDSDGDEIDISMSLLNEVGNSRFLLEGNVRQEFFGETREDRRIVVDQNYSFGGEDSADIFKTIINNLLKTDATKTEFELSIDSFTEKLSELYDRIPEQEINQTVQNLRQNQYRYNLSTINKAKKSIYEQLINQKVTASSIDLLNSISSQIQNVTNQSLNGTYVKNFTLESGLNIYTFFDTFTTSEYILCSPEKIENTEQIKDGMEFVNLARSNTSLLFEKSGDELLDTEITIVDEKPLEDDKSFDSVTIHSSGNRIHSAKYPIVPHITRFRHPKDEYFSSIYSTELSENTDAAEYTFEYPTNLEDILEKALKERKSGIGLLSEYTREAFINKYQSLYLILSKEREKIREQQAVHKESNLSEQSYNKEQSTAEQSVSEDTIPEQSVPEDTIPEQSVPENTIPEQSVPENTIPEQSEMNTDTSDTHSQNEYETLSLEQLGQKIQQVDEQINLLRQSISSLTSLENLPGIKENIKSLNDSLSELETTRVRIQQAENLVAGKTAQKIEEVIKNLVQLQGQEAVCAELQAQLKMLYVKYPDISRNEIRDSDGR